MPTDVFGMNHIEEAVTECPPVFEVEIFFSKKYFFDENSIICMELALIYNDNSVMYFSVNDVFIYDEFEEIIFEYIIG